MDTKLPSRRQHNPSLCLPTPLLYPENTKQVSAQGTPGWKGAGAGMGPTVPDLKHPRGFLRREEGEEGRVPGWDVLRRSPPLMLISTWWGPARAQEPPRAWLGTQLSLPPPHRAGSTCQHKHTGTHHFSFSILFPPPTLAIEAKWRQPAGPKRRVAAPPRPAARESYFGPAGSAPEAGGGGTFFRNQNSSYYQKHNGRALAPAQPQTVGPAALPVNPLEGGPGGLPTTLAASPTDG